MRKAPLEPMRLLAIQLALSLVYLFLLTDVLPDLGLIQSHRAHPVTRRPKMQPGHPPLLQQLPMNPHRTLACQKAQRVRHAGLRRNTQTQVDIIRPTMPFYQLHSSLAAQLPQDRADLPLQLPVEHPLPVLGDEDHGILAFPSDMGQTLPVVQRVLLPAPAGLPGGRTSAFEHQPARWIAPKLFGSHGQRPWY